MAAFDSNAPEQQSKNVLETVGDYAPQAIYKVSETRGRGPSVVKHLSQRARQVDETTIPDAFRSVPKYISPRVHSWLDFAVTTYFIGLGVWFAMHGRGRAATAAFINGAMVAGVSALTDYEGDGRKPLSFKMHGTLDAVQAATAALGPVLNGFAGEPEAEFFWGQAATEVGVIATTDWDAGMSESQRLNVV